MQVAGAILCFVVTLYVAVATFGLLARVLRQRLADQTAAEILRCRLQTNSLQRNATEQKNLHWHGVRKFTVDRRDEESHDTVSFYLKAHDRRPLPVFLAGQFLTFRLHVPGELRPVVRCYSLSNKPNSDVYRITVRRMGAGIASNFMHDCVREGDILDVMAPRGDFCLPPGHFRPTVLLAGGVGITPVLSMLHSIADSDNGGETWLIHGIRDPQDRLMAEEITALANKNANLRVRVGYSSGAEATRDAGTEANFNGRISVDYLKHILASSNYEYYICGPPPMMKSLVADLKTWGVPSSSIHTEAFGPDSVKSVNTAMKDKPEAVTAPAGTGSAVSFVKSSKTAAWGTGADTLLSLAESVAVSIDAGCRAGSCGSCLTAIRSGRVRYLETPGFQCEDGSCLPCICVPDGQLELDA